MDGSMRQPHAKHRIPEAKNTEEDGFTWNPDDMTTARIKQRMF